MKNPVVDVEKMWKEHRVSRRKMAADSASGQENQGKIGGCRKELMLREEEKRGKKHGQILPGERKKACLFGKIGKRKPTKLRRMAEATEPRFGRNGRSQSLVRDSVMETIRLQRRRTPGHDGQKGRICVVKEEEYAR